MQNMVMTEPPVTATDVAILFVLWMERRPLSLGEIVSRANVPDHVVVTLLDRLVRDDLAHRTAAYAADWPPSGRYRLTRAGRQWAATAIADRADPPVEPAGVPAVPRRDTRMELTPRMREALVKAGDDGLLLHWSMATQNALVVRKLADPVVEPRYSFAARKVVPTRVGTRLNEAGMARRARLIRRRTRQTTPFGIDAQTPGP